MKNHYYEILYFIFALVSRANPVLGLKITTQRLEILVDLIKDYDMSLEKIVQKIENMILVEGLRKKILNEKFKESLEQYMNYKCSRNLEFDENVLELWFRKFIDFSIGSYNEIEKIILIILGVLKYYLTHGDFHFPKGKSYPYNLRKAKSLILRIDEVVDEKKDKLSIEFLNEFKEIRRILSDFYKRAYIKNNEIFETKKKIKKIIEEG